MIYAILILAVLPVHDCLQCLLFCIWVDWPKILLSRNHRHRKPPAHHRAAHPLPVRFAGYPPYLFPWKSIHEQANCCWIFVIFKFKKKPTLCLKLSTFSYVPVKQKAFLRWKINNHNQKKLHEIVIFISVYYRKKVVYFANSLSDVINLSEAVLSPAPKHAIKKWASLNVRMWSSAWSLQISLNSFHLSFTLTPVLN